MLKIVTALALFAPASMQWIKMSWVNPLLMIVMLGMGLTLKLSDFRACFTNPKGVIGQTILRYTITPLIALGLTKLFKLPSELAIGFILVAVCPGGTASNFASMPMAAIPGAIFSVWHNVFGAVIANLMAKAVDKGVI